MTLIIQKPTGAKLVMAKDFSFDADAAAYIAAVEAADTQALETATRYAINDFVIGCKQDGIWSAIKASCILAGARTLTGALVPLVGTAPTNVGGLFVSGDYNRKTGLVGNGSTKYLDSNRNNNADPQDSKHVAVFATAVAVGAASNFPTYIGAGRASTGATNFGVNSASSVIYSRHNTGTFTANSGLSTVPGLFGLNRSTNISYLARSANTFSTINVGTSTPFNGNMFIFNDNNAGVAPADTASNARLAFYSIGESLGLALLDARVTDLINAFAAAIP
jgi:hypothetical protein